MGGSPSVADKNKYACAGEDYFTAQYMSSEQGESRIFRLTRNGTPILFSGAVGFKQTLEECPEHPATLIISYKIRASRQLDNVGVQFGYTSGEKVDGMETISIFTDWQYRLFVVSIDYPVEYERSLLIDLSDSLCEGQWCEIADLNIVPLADIAAFGYSTKARIGKVKGVVDPVFGVLEGYGAYFQHLYATRNVNIAGTLTAGDENGFSSTFYVGKIHKNVIFNSTEGTFVDPQPVLIDHNPPAGTGNVWLMGASSKMEVQSTQWRTEHTGQLYCFSLWLKAEEQATISIYQDEFHVRDIAVAASDGWRRFHASFRIRESQSIGMSVRIDSSITGVLLSSPQMEAGGTPSQYQPTDGTLSYVEDYGAWFSKGGIGGTIQNPLLKLENDGSIRSANGSFVINPDGSGYFAGGKFGWDSEHIVLKELDIDWAEVAPHLPKPVSPRADIASNQPFTQVYTRDTNSTHPNWAVSPYLVLTPSLFVSSFDNTDRITVVAGDGTPGIKPGSVVWYKDNKEIVSGTSQSSIANAAGKYALTIKTNCMDTWSPQMTFSFAAIYIDEHGVENLVRAEKQFTLLSAPGAAIMAIMTTPDGVVFRGGEPSALRLHCDLWRGAKIDNKDVSYVWGVPDPTVFSNTQVAEAVPAGVTQVKVRSTDNMVPGTEFKIISTSYTIVAVDHQAGTVSFTPETKSKLLANAIVTCPRYNALLGGGWVALDENNPRGALSGWTTDELSLSSQAVAGCQTFKCAIRDEDMNKDNASAGAVVYATVSVSDLTVPDVTSLDWIDEWNTNKTHIGAELVVTPKIFTGVKHDDGLLTGVALGHIPLTMYNGDTAEVIVRDVDGIVGTRYSRWKVPEMCSSDMEGRASVTMLHRGE